MWELFYCKKDKIILKIFTDIQRKPEKIEHIEMWYK